MFREWTSMDLESDVFDHDIGCKELTSEKTAGVA
jgi:hypothetical protein